MVFKRLIQLPAGWSSDKATLRFSFSSKVSYNSHRICHILLHPFAKGLIGNSFSVSLRSRDAYGIGILLIVAMVLNPYPTVLCPLHHLWLSHFVQFVRCLNCAFSLDIEPAMLERGTTRAMTNEWDMTAVHTVNCHCDEFKYSVDETDCLANAREIVSYVNSSQYTVTGSRYPLVSHIYIFLACPLCLPCPDRWTHPTHLCYRIAWPFTIY